MQRPPEPFPETKPSWRDRCYRLYERYRRTFWVLHSLWALATGLVVVVLAHERYDYAGWVLGFLVFTWLSTLFFSRLATGDPDSPRARLGHEFVSYLTRVMYQETLFFLLPFYYYSTTLDAPNVLFLGLLAALAVLSCLDLLFDDLLRRRRWFGLVFFALVSFAALDFLLPLVLGLGLEVATPLAAGIGLAAALPLVYEVGDLRRPRVLGTLVLSVAAIVGLLSWGRAFIPPVPLQLSRIVFAEGVRAEDIEPIHPLGATVERAHLGGSDLAMIATIFAPRRLEARIELEWSRNGERLETSREIEVSPHEAGFRVWDLLQTGEQPLAAGRYRVAIHTTTGQLVGRRELRVTDSRSDPP